MGHLQCDRLNRLEGNETMRTMNQTAYVTRDDWTDLGATPEQDQQIREAGWIVVNAPRPLPYYGDMTGDDGKPVPVGGVEWTGDPRFGVFYAAGSPEWIDTMYGTLGQHWCAQDATP